jgi:hypothetical protein
MKSETEQKTPVDNSDARVTQVAVESLVKGTPHIHVTQICVEILTPRVPNAK